MRITACHNAKEPKRNMKPKRLTRFCQWNGCWVLAYPCAADGRGRWQGPVLVLLRLSPMDEQLQIQPTPCKVVASLHEWVYA